MLDYDALPFLSSQSPYFEFFRGRTREATRGLRSGPAAARRVYGWGRTPIYTSGATAWVLDDAIFGGCMRRATRSGPRSRPTAPPTRCCSSTIVTASTPSAIRRVTWFDHAVHVAELATLALLFFLALGRRGGPGSPSRAAPRLAGLAARARGSDELLAQAVPRVRGGVHHPGPGARLRDSRLRRDPTPRRRRGRGGAHGGRGAARRRGDARGAARRRGVARAPSPTTRWCGSAVSSSRT